jgi:hypothetical protein
MRVLPQPTQEDREQENGGRVAGRIGRYQLIGLLATGGMAEVYLALSGELSGFRTLVVVKRILPHLASNTEFIRVAQGREAKGAADARAGRVPRGTSR